MVRKKRKGIHREREGRGREKGRGLPSNKKMRNVYSDHYFVELLGKPVGKLWSEYKAKYSHHRIKLLR